MEIDDLKLMTEVTKEVALEAYKDGLKPTVQETGKLLERIPRVINSLFLPIDTWIAKREYKLEEVKAILAEKLKDIPEERLATPELYIAVPALEAISYSMDNEQLKNMYANLLARAMLKSEQSKVHPSFVEILKQLSPNDADLFKDIMERNDEEIFKVTKEGSPIIHLLVSHDGRGSSDFHFNISWRDNYEVNKLSLSNLQRLGLIEIPTGKYYTNDKMYDIVRQTKSYNHIFQKLQEKYPQNDIRETKTCVIPSALADLFYDVCVKDDIDI